MGFFVTRLRWAMTSTTRLDSPFQKLVRGVPPAPATSIDACEALIKAWDSSGIVTLYVRPLSTFEFSYCSDAEFKKG